MLLWRWVFPFESRPEKRTRYDVALFSISLVWLIPSLDLLWSPALYSCSIIGDYSRLLLNGSDEVLNSASRWRSKHHVHRRVIVGVMIEVTAMVAGVELRLL